jgi:hypothetical protein
MKDDNDRTFGITAINNLRLETQISYHNPAFYIFSFLLFYAIPLKYPPFGALLHLQLVHH